MVEAAKIAVVNPCLDRRLHGWDIQVVPGAVDDTVPSSQLAKQGGRIAGVEGDRRCSIIPRRDRECLRLSGVPPGNPYPLDAGTLEKIRDRGLGDRPVAAEDEDLQRAPRSPEAGTSFTVFAKASISDTLVAARMAQPERMRPTPAPNANDYRRDCAAHPQRGGQRIEP